MGVSWDRVLKLAIILWLLATITIGLQFWIGDRTIYTQQLEQQRQDLHFGILENKAPGGGGWGSVGGLTIQKRIGVVYLAESLRKITKLTVGKVYKLLDSVFLFIALVGLFFYLKKWLPDTYSLIGVLYFSAMLPLTYFFQLFHPWDRLQLTIWVGLLFLVADRHFYLLAIGLLLSILVKFDTIMLPFLYFIVHFKCKDWRRTGIEALVLLLLAIGAYMALGQLFPAPLDHNVGFNWNTASLQVQKNVQTLNQMNVRFPPILVHALPIFLSLLFFQLKDRFVCASVAFAIGLSVVYIMFSNYEEVRAHMVVLVLVLPSALMSLRRILEVGVSSAKDAAMVSTRSA